MSIKVFAPATIANLSVGFDVLGLALQSKGDIVALEKNNSTKNAITEIINGVNIPYDISKNCCAVVIHKMQEQLDRFEGVDIKITKGFASGSGLGSSSASSAAAAFAYNELMQRPFSPDKLVTFAAEGERIACGSAHADNVAPAILGGLVLVRSHNPIDIIRLPIPPDLHAVVLFPNVKIPTAEARAVMQQQIALNQASKQWANMGAFVASLYQNNLELMKKSLQDVVAEPIRAQFIPFFNELKQAAMQKGAIGFGISGSGPSVFALADSQATAQSIQKAMLAIFDNSDIQTLSFVEHLHNNTGCKIIE